MSKPPITQSPGRKEKVKEMFNSIAGRYDFLNHFLSFGIDHWWRKRLVKEMAARNPQAILDVATGTADLAIAASRLKPIKITGTDIAEEMLEIGKKKIQKLGLTDTIELLKADSENLPFADETYDAAMVAFGVRNYEDLQKGLNEMYRILKKEGSAYILEFSRPMAFPVKQLYSFYFKIILPLLGRVVSRHSDAYTYLPESVSVFPQGEKFLEIMQKSGFRNTRHSSLTMGICSLYTGEK